MFIVKDDHPDFTYSLGPIALMDSEGNQITPTEAFAYDVTSDNPAAITVTPDLDDAGAQKPSGSIHVGGPNGDGTPAVANLAARVTYLGNIIHMSSASFTVTTGDTATITGGDIVFTGLE